MKNTYKYISIIILIACFACKQGEIGPQGPIGVVGDAGTNGKDNTTVGPVGSVGATGSVGLTGATGDKGAAGATGTSNLIITDWKKAVFISDNYSLGLSKYYTGTVLVPELTKEVLNTSVIIGQQKTSTSIIDINTTAISIYNGFEPFSTRFLGFSEGKIKIELRYPTYTKLTEKQILDYINTNMNDFRVTILKATKK